MKLLYGVVGLGLCSAAAQAEVAGELSAGAGGDTAAPSGFATATGSINWSVTRAAPDIMARGLAIVSDDPDHPGGLWVFTGLDPDDRDGVGATVDGTLHLQPDAEVPGTAWFAGRAWARGAGWQLEARGLFQPVGDLRDRFWRSGRGILQTNVAVEVPAMWSLGTPTFQFSAMAVTVDLGKRLARSGEGWAQAGFDRDISMVAARLRSKSLTFDIITGHYIEFGVAKSMTSTTTFGTSAVALDLDFADLTWRAARDVALTMHGGVAMRAPVSPFMINGSTETSSGPEATTPDLGIEVRSGTALDPRTNGYTTSFGAGTWTRLDPTGHAVDAGVLATADADWRNGRYRLGGALQVGRLRRVLLGDQAPVGLVPVGTRMWMGRGSALAEVRVTGSMLASATLWLEQSDRDDPRWLVPASGALTRHAGADVTALWRFR